MNAVDNIIWVQIGKSEKVHAIREDGRDRGLFSTEYTLCGKVASLAPAWTIEANAIMERAASIEQASFCGICKRSLYAWGFLKKPETAEVPNRLLTIPGVYLSDVVTALKEQGIELTELNINAATIHVASIAFAHAEAMLQDTKREEWLEWIETFK